MYYSHYQGRRMLPLVLCRHNLLLNEKNEHTRTAHGVRGDLKRIPWMKCNKKICTHVLHSATCYMLHGTCYTVLSTFYNLHWFTHIFHSQFLCSVTGNTWTPFGRIRNIIWRNFFMVDLNKISSKQAKAFSDKTALAENIVCVMLIMNWQTKL